MTNKDNSTQKPTYRRVLFEIRDAESPGVIDLLSNVPSRCEAAFIRGVMRQWLEGVRNDGMSVQEAISKLLSTYGTGGAIPCVPQRGNPRTSAARPKIASFPKAGGVAAPAPPSVSASSVIEGIGAVSEADLALTQSFMENMLGSR